jgi:ribosomal protein S18 acetylase RimI-like enzyme
MEIIKLSQITKNREDILAQVENIFFVSSSLKSFSSEERKQAFYKRWCKDYQQFYPEEFYIMIEDGKVLGYLSGCCDSTKALEVLEVPGYSAFKDLFDIYPAHLHINFHPQSRGRGLGSLLIRHYVSSLKSIKLHGLHLVTSRDAQNVSFYERLGFSFTEGRKFNEMELYFMGWKFD